MILTSGMNTSLRRLTVLIDARLQTGIAGGVEQFVIGLATGLRANSDDATTFVFLGYEGQIGWLNPTLASGREL